MVRHAWSSPQEIAQQMECCKQAGFNAVLFQVRGNGTAFYRSKLEPLAEEYRTDPGFDPLEVACREAHARGLAIHAWVNVMPAWRGHQPPADPNQLYNKHPDWFWYDQRGQRQPLGNFYVSLNACRPEVREYLVTVFEDIVRRYPVDGLHLDYCRFPMEEAPRGRDYPRDARTLAIYKAATGRTPDANKTAWTNWRIAQVSRLVADVRTMMRRVRPTARLTASCGGEYEDWRLHYFQDGPAWLRANLVDAVMVMNYTNNLNVYRRQQQAWWAAAPGKWVAPGIGLHTHRNVQATIDQLRLAQQWGHGFALFSSESLFARDAMAQQRLQAVGPILRAGASKSM